MSRFTEDAKEQVSDFVETVKHSTEAAVEHGKADYHEAKAKLAEAQERELDKAPLRLDKFKQMAA